MPNTITNVAPQLLAQGLLALRENAVLPRLVNRSYENQAAERGDTVDIPIPSAVTAATVAPAATPAATADSAPTKVTVPLDQWKEAAFYLTDKDKMEVMNGVIPMQASEAIKALGNTVDNYILGLYKGVYGYTGTAGTTPFATTADATQARKILNNQLAPLDDRRFVIDADAEAKALELRAFQDMSFSGSATEIVEGRINRKFGFDWFMDQNVPTHTNTGTGTILVNDASTAVGDTTLTWAGGGTQPVEGDVFTVANDTQTYVVASSTATVITMYPAAKVAWQDNAAVTFKASHAVNLAFHRDAFAFATRPLAGDTDGLGSLIQSAVDPVSGLTLRLEVSREHKRTRYSYDILYGAALVRRELATRIAG